MLGGPPPRPIIGAIRDNKDYIRVLLYSYYTTITERGVLLRNTNLIQNTISANIALTTDALDLVPMVFPCSLQIDSPFLK